MATPGDMWTCPTMIEIKNYSGVNMKYDITEVVADTPKGGFEITVGSVSKIKAGDWVCLYVKTMTRNLLPKK